MRCFSYITYTSVVSKSAPDTKCSYLHYSQSAPYLSLGAAFFGLALMLSLFQYENSVKPKNGSSIHHLFSCINLMSVGSGFSMNLEIKDLYRGDAQKPSLFLVRENEN